MIPSLGIKYALWVGSNLNSVENIENLLRPELERGVLSRHDFDEASTSPILREYSAAPIYGVAFGALASASILLGTHLLARRLKIQNMFSTTQRTSPLLFPFLVTAPVCLGYTTANMLQAKHFEKFATRLEDRAAFALALRAAAERDGGWLGRGTFDEERVRAWEYRLVGHLQAGTLAPPKEELLPYLNRNAADGHLGTSDSPSAVEAHPVDTPLTDPQPSSEGASKPRRRWWWPW